MVPRRCQLSSGLCTALPRWAWAPGVGATFPTVPARGGSQDRPVRQRRCEPQMCRFALCHGAGGLAWSTRQASLLVSSQEALQNLYRTKSFLFVGCGETLRDQIFQALFLYSVPNKVDLEHYMVVLKESEDHFFKQQADMLLHGIKVVSYGDCFDDFPGYVQDLATQICKQWSPGTHRCRLPASVYKTGRFLPSLRCNVWTTT